MVSEHREKTGEPLPAAILLDLDDTILAYGDPEECWQAVCRRFAPPTGVSEVEDLLVAIRAARDWYWGDLNRHREGRLNLQVSRREIVALAFSYLSIDSPKVARDLADAYAKLREGRAQLFPGSIATLEHFRRQGVRLGLVTNGSSDMQRGKLERFGLEPCFDHILIEGEFGIGKPDEQVFRHALEQLNVAPTDAWMVGDDLERDVAGAQRVGLYSIWVDWRGDGLPESSPVHPDRIISTLSELR